MSDGENLFLDLTNAERLVLRCGLNEWRGPAHCTEELAVAIGWGSESEFFAHVDSLMDAVLDGSPLSPLNEIVFVSNLVGSGYDWTFTTGLSDDQTLETLRRIQRKLPRQVYEVVGNGLGTLPSL